MINRIQFLKEQHARSLIRDTIMFEKEAELEEHYEAQKVEAKIRSYIRKQIQEAKVADKIPHESTGINILEELLKKIIKILEEGYKSLTTDPKQRVSYRTHILNAMMNSIAPPRAINRADLENLSGFRSDELNDLNFPDSPAGDLDSGIDGADLQQNQEQLPAEDEGLDLNPDEEEEEGAPITLEEIAINRLAKLIQEQIGDEEIDDPIAQKQDEPGIIDIDGQPEPDPTEDFGVENENQDLTGRNVAFNTFQKIENSIIDAYDLLSEEADQQIFYVYLLVNTMLYFRRFEEELKAVLPEPVVDAYKDASYEGPGIQKGSESGGTMPPEQQVSSVV